MIDDAGALQAELLELARGLAADAAALALAALEGPRAEVDTKSSATDIVTEVDRAAERLIVTGIRSARRDDGLLGEEGAVVEGTTGLRWLIDPIDGTTNYLYGHPGFAVSIACERHGETLVGVVNDPLHGDVFESTKGGGARRNGESIAVNTNSDLTSALVATGFGYDAGHRRAQAAVVAKVIGSIRDIRRMGAAAVDLCSVACGRVDAYYERGLNSWDLAAGSLIAEEAGARLGAIGGGAPTPGSIVAASPAIYDELQALLVEAGAVEHD